MSDFNIKIQEIELKYYAENISLDKFIKFAVDQNPNKKLFVGSYDTYYSSPSYMSDNGLEFVRFRHGITPELTIKIKTSSKNNNSRIEVDLPLSKSVSKFIVDKFLALLGFQENFQIYKDCYIYYYDKLTIVYYRVLDKEDGKVLSTFIEVEARKDANFDDEDHAWAYVKDMERKLSSIGISPQNRLRRSLWEIFRRSVSNLDIKKKLLDATTKV